MARSGKWLATELVLAQVRAHGPVRYAELRRRLPAGVHPWRLFAVLEWLRKDGRIQEHPVYGWNLTDQERKDPVV